MAYDSDLCGFFLTKSADNFIEVVLKIADPVRGKILSVILLSLMMAACQEASNAVIDDSAVIENVSAPDSVQTGNVSLTLYATVQDPNGLNDIQRVYFTVTKPDGTPSTGNPFPMYDDGGSGSAAGDVNQTAGDGIYTLGINLSSSNPLGTYTFTFYAVTRSGITSSPVVHQITVYQ